MGSVNHRTWDQAVIVTINRSLMRNILTLVRELVVNSIALPLPTHLFQKPTHLLIGHEHLVLIVPYLVPIVVCAFDERRTETNPVAHSSDPCLDIDSQTGRWIVLEKSLHDSTAADSSPSE